MPKDGRVNPLMTSLANRLLQENSGRNNGRLPALYSAPSRGNCSPLTTGRKTQRQISSKILRADPLLGALLMRELSGLWKFKLRRFRIIYELDRKAQIIRVLAIGHRREVY